MIDRDYGHLARDGRDHAIRLLDAYRAPESSDVHARWTPGGHLTRHPTPSLTTEKADSREKSEAL
jgi:hypothetical protein